MNYVFRHPLAGSGRVSLPFRLGYLLRAACVLPGSAGLTLGLARLRLLFAVRTPSRLAARKRARNIRAGPELRARASGGARRGHHPRHARPVTELSLGGYPAASRDGGVHAKLKLDPKREALLAERAHAMRQAPTRSEAALWRLLSGGKLGVGFRRQVPLGGRYVADFLAPSARLVVEVDGAWHHRRTQSDARRDQVLRRLGYRVLRLPANPVLEQPREAVARVREVLTLG